MIPYDDLVAALSAWRARQGLPVSAMGGGGSGATPTPGSGPTAKPGSGPNRAAPPAPPPSRPAIAPPIVDEQVEEAMLDEEAYESEGNDFAMSFGGENAAAAVEHDADGDATSIGSVPERPTEMDLAPEDEKDEW